MFAQKISYNNIKLNSSKSFHASISGDAWYTFWSPSSGIESLGIELKYDIKPTLIYNFKSYFQIPFITFELNRSSSEMEQKKLQSSNIKNIAKYVSYFGYLNTKLFDNRGVKVDLLYANFKGNLTVDNGSVFGINENAKFNMDSKWFKCDIIFLINNTEAYEIGCGYRYINYNKPQALIKFYGKSNNDSSFGTVEATELISAQIEQATLVGQYLLFYLNIKNDIYREELNYNGVFAHFMVGLGNAYVKGETSRISNKMGATLDCSLGKCFYIRIKDNPFFTLKIGYKFLLNKINVAEELGKDNHGDIFYGTYSTERWHGPFFAGGIMF